MGHVLFLDVVGYSKLSMDRQTETLRQLQDSVRSTDTFLQASTEPDSLISLPTGDGMALVFFRGLTAHVRCAIELGTALKEHPDLELRMGLHSGPVHRVSDINDSRNVSGGGINVAQRVMDCGDAGHILLSKSVADVLRQLGGWGEKLRDLGEVEVKHGERIHIYNLVDGNRGNPAIPSKVEAQRQAQISLSAPSPSGHSFSDEETELLICAAGDGEIVVMSTDETSDWVRAGARDFFDGSDRAVAALYLEALDSLRRRGLVRHSGGVLYELTGTGFKQARELKSAREH
jgi:class 3 adenylate cyclase